ncbi:tumor protein p53-inducible nuclear protein 2 isoform X2 [Brienomyrus brachyistius]|uniref:tumor protein p53-inducible nuclear protein 2 isoform X2 n=1 Tax=Brienomyrus brachyistius TaxID=42636 RepID=UPI0020B3BA55|nr:tumor protein p53-inducible nuclear protein 2 isoform X2 [Brienomyrus brachyistius]
MLQRLSTLLFGEVEDASTDISGPKPCVMDADEEGWLLVNLPGEGAPVETRPSSSELTAPLHSCEGGARGSSSSMVAPLPSPSCNHHRTKITTTKSLERSPPALPDSSVYGPLLAGSSPRTPGSTPAPPGPRSDCSCAPDHCCMDESWFVTPPACFTAEGATAESSPIEDLLIEHPSMSVYVALGNQSVQDSVASLTGSVRVAEAVPPASQDSAPRRIPRGAAAKAGAMVKVTQVTRVQRAKARAERRHLARNRVQRQNRVREQASRRPAHTHGTYLRQPCQRTLNH